MNARATSLATIVASAVLCTLAWAPSALAGAGPASKSATQAADFAAKEKQLQDESRSSASGPLPSPTTSAKSLNKSKDAGKGMLEAEAKLQTSPTRGLGSPTVDKTARNVDPMKNISKMTTPEKDQLLREVQKEAKP